MWFILYFVCFFYIFFQARRRPILHRRVLLIDLINMHKIHQIEWLHRGQKYIIMLTSQSVAKPSRNRRVGIREANGIIIRHFWLDGKLCNTDTFAMKKLHWQV